MASSDVRKPDCISLFHADILKNYQVNYYMQIKEQKVQLKVIDTHNLHEIFAMEKPASTTSSKKGGATEDDLSSHFSSTQSDSPTERANQLMLTKNKKKKLLAGYKGQSHLHKQAKTGSLGIVETADASQCEAEEISVVHASSRNAASNSSLASLQSAALELLDHPKSITTVDEIVTAIVEPGRFHQIDFYSVNWKTRKITHIHVFFERKKSAEILEVLGNMGIDTIVIRPLHAIVTYIHKWFRNEEKYTLLNEENVLLKECFLSQKENDEYNKQIEHLCTHLVGKKRRFHDAHFSS